ncbi:MAG: hypothetical protein R3B36_17550 [Polyangiaceae bacterium]
MISSGDPIALLAFRAQLRDEPSWRHLVADQGDARDVLRIHDLGAAIARAERIVRGPAFGVLDAEGLDDETPTLEPPPMASFDDDCVGPAVYAPVLPTPIPPAPALPRELVPAAGDSQPVAAAATSPLRPLLVACLLSAVIAALGAFVVEQASTPEAPAPSVAARAVTAPEPARHPQAAQPAPAAPAADPAAATIPHVDVDALPRAR